VSAAERSAGGGAISAPDGAGSRKFQSVRPDLPLNCRAWRAAPASRAGVDDMSKGIDRKKETKKKPAMNLMEKRAAKAEKKKNK
jgi:hypothetical protein